MLYGLIFFISPNIFLTIFNFNKLNVGIPSSQPLSGVEGFQGVIANLMSLLLRQSILRANT